MDYIKKAYEFYHKRDKNISLADFEKSQTILAMGEFCKWYLEQEDLRRILLTHSRRSEVKTACLHFLGDKFQRYEAKLEQQRQEREKMYSVVEKLEQIGINFVIGGSLSLYLYGVIDREIGDLDLIIYDKGEFNKFIQNFEVVDDEYLGDDRLTKKDRMKILAKSLQKDNLLNWLENFDANQMRFLIDGINVCVFYSNEQEDSTYFLVGEHEIKASQPQFAIQVKRKYLKKFDTTEMHNWDEFKKEKYVKHLTDILNYEKWLKARNE